MASVKVRVNPSGAREIMNSAAVQNILLGHASRIASSASGMGSGRYTSDVRPGINRAHARASTADRKSFWSERKHNSLLKALGGGR